MPSYLFVTVRMMQRFERSADEILAVSPAAPATPASSPAAIAAAAAAAGPGASAAIMSLSPVRAPSLGSVIGMGLSISAPNTGDTEVCMRYTSQAFRSHENRVILMPPRGFHFIFVVGLVQLTSFVENLHIRLNRHQAPSDPV